MTKVNSTQNITFAPTVQSKNSAGCLIGRRTARRTRRANRAL
ncbi:MAG: hypothetical protein ABJG88_03370 [Litorimonas sp.]